MTFDPATHRFGMAYKNTFGHVVYPSDVKQTFGHSCNDRVISIRQGYKSSFYSLPQDLTRAPEHDLIPRADVLKLMIALQSFPGFNSNSDEMASWVKSCLEAEDEFTVKHGSAT